MFVTRKLESADSVVVLLVAINALFSQTNYAADARNVSTIAKSTDSITTTTPSTRRYSDSEANNSYLDSFNKNDSILCGKIHRSIDEFPPDYFTDEQRRHGAIIIHILVALYGFLLISFVCHDYFLPSVFSICSALEISPDVAGATFMASATCTSELFVTVIGTFLTESDIGVGTVVGSGVYNTLGVSACAGLAANRAITMEKWPLLRDSVIYVMVISTLAVIAIDNVVMWYEAAIMVILYFGYFIFLFTQDKIVAAVKDMKSETSCRSWTAVFVYIKRLFLSALFCGKFTQDESQNFTGYKNYSQSYGTVENQSPPTITITTATTSVSDRTDVDEELMASSSTQSCGNCLSTVWWAFCLPIEFMLLVTVPDCRTNRKLYPFTFIMSIVWISVVMYILSWMLTICGETFMVNDIVMGIGVLAIGSSIPEAVSGIINARNGEGAMTISSALGSNTMDILLCLGLPWLIKCLLPASMNGGPVRMETDTLFFNCMCMIVGVVVLNAAAAVSGFELHKPFGVICLIGQVAVMTVMIVNCLHAIKDPGTVHC